MTKFYFVILYTILYYQHNDDGSRNIRILYRSLKNFKSFRSFCCFQLELARRILEEVKFIQTLSENSEFLWVLSAVSPRGVDQLPENLYLPPGSLVVYPAGIPFGADLVRGVAGIILRLLKQRSHLPNMFVDVATSPKRTPNSGCFEEDTHRHGLSRKTSHLQTTK